MKLIRSTIQNRILLIFILICLVLFRYDFTYNLLPYKVNGFDTLWKILEEKVYKNSAITGISLQYLQSTNTNVDFDKIMENNQGQGGYKVSILFNKLTIIGPNNKPIISNALILPGPALINHALQILTYDLVILGFAAFLYTNFKDNKFRFNLLFLKNAFLVPTSLFIVMLVIMFILSFLIIIVLNFLPRAGVVPILINPEATQPMQELQILDKSYDPEVFRTVGPE